MNNILMIGAHYDDVELGCGGTAAKLVSRGKNVYKMTLTDNEFVDPRLGGDGGVMITNDLSHLSSSRACKLLGVRQIMFHQSKYGQLFYTSGMMKEIEAFVLDNSVDTLFFHFSNDMHHDHIAAYEICKTAGRHCANLLAYQSNGYIKDRAFNPNYFVDISDFVELKKKALKYYEEDQAEQNRSGRLFDIVIKQNEIYGYGNSCGYCEGFEAIKLLNEMSV